MIITVLDQPQPHIHSPISPLLHNQAAANFCNLNFIMHKISLNTLTIEPIKKRLYAIVENHLKTLAIQLETNPAKAVNFNQSLLQDWMDILQKMIYLKEGKAKQTKALNQNELNNKIPVLKQLSLPNPTHMQCNNQFLLNLEPNSCQVYELVNQKGLLQINSTILAFQKGYIRKYCSYNFIDDNTVILIGGSRQSNPNLKSKQVLRLNVQSSEISKVGQLPYGVSSHSAIKVKQTIFIVGGNKDMNVVTKSCLSLTIDAKTVKKISNLNYPSASHSTISWNDEFIYKFGGIGSCFGSWDLSPYIEKYSIKQDQWTVINPVLKVQESLLDHYSLFANSLAYVTSDNSILILGGYDFNFQGSNKVLEMSIRKVTSPKSENEYQHEIINIASVDGLQCGGFLQQEPMLVNNELIAVQTVTQKKSLEGKVVAFSRKIRYF